MPESLHIIPGMYFYRLIIQLSKYSGYTVIFLIQYSGRRIQVVILRSDIGYRFPADVGKCESVHKTHWRLQIIFVNGNHILISYINVMRIQFTHDLAVFKRKGYAPMIRFRTDIKQHEIITHAQLLMLVSGTVYNS